MKITNIKETKTVVKDAEYYRQKIGVKKKNPKELEKIFNKIDKALEEMSKSSGMSVDEST
jgi:uncharacterized protein involved in exopolysaccharide biosynthesis